MFYDDPTQMLNPDTYETFLALLQGDESSQLEGLLILSDCLTIGNADVLGAFPVAETGQFLAIIMQSPNPELVNLSTQCVHMFLEAHPASTRSLIRAGALPVMKSILERGTPKEAVSNIVHSCSIIGDFRPDELVEPIGISPLIKHFKNMRNSEKLCSLKAALKIAQSNVIPQFLDAVEPLLDILETSSDYSNLAVELLNKIISSNTDNDISEQSAKRILKLSNECKNPPQQHNYFRIFCAITKKLPLAQVVYDYPYNYKRIFDVNWGAEDSQMKRLFLNVVVNLLPNVELPDEYWATNKFVLPDYSRFAHQIKPLIVQLIIKKSGNEDLLLSALTSTVQFEPLEWTDDLVSAIGSLSANKDMAPFVLLLLLATKDTNVICMLDSYNVLSRHTVKEKVQEWYKGALERLKAMTPKDAGKDKFNKASFRKPEDVALFVTENSDVTPFVFQTSLLDKATKAFEKAKEEMQFPENYIKLKSIVVSLLKFAPFPTVTDPLSRYSASDLTTKMISVTIKGPSGYEKSAQFSLKSDLGSVGLSYLLESGKVRVGDMSLENALANSKYKDVIVFPHSETGVTLTQISTVLSDVPLPNVEPMKYMVNGKGPFAPYDQLFTALAQTNEKPEDITSKTQIIEIMIGTCSRHEPNIPNQFEPITHKILHFAELFFNYTHMSIIDESFDLQCRAKLSSPLLTMGFFSPQSRVIYHYPLLFTLSTRFALLRTAFVDLENNQAFVRTVFNKERWVDNSEMRTKVVVRRTHVLEDGLLIVRGTGPGCLKWDTTWEDEPGIGRGPTKEFINLFALELCRPSLGMWRNESAGEFAGTSIGLFPAPFVSDKFWELGCLCAKALLMEIPINIPLSEHFFAAVIGEKVTIEQIDPSYANSLKCTDGLIGLPFEYPGTEKPLSQTQKEVTAKNVKEFVQKVVDATVGSGIQGAVDEFRKGFSTVIPWQALKVFHPNEICTLICGENANFSSNEFRENLEIASGYTNNAPEIEMLCRVIDDFSGEQKAALIKFITGSSKLPIGGLKNLQPRITVARRVVEEGEPDDSLPSVMTCTNYLKLPSYSNAEIMKKKILIAIYECSTSFLLT